MEGRTVKTTRHHLQGTVSALAMLLAAAAGTGALAQPAAAPAPSGSSDLLEEIVISGIRSSLIRSLETKRDANAIVDAITAEDIGKFPDKNVAESLSKIPGITVDRDFGEGERVAIRGTDPALNRTLLNGQSVASTDWFILDAPGRTFNYTMLAPEVVGRLEVYKSPEARIDEGSIGGTVILHTRKPLDMKDALTVSGNVEYSYNDRAEEGSPNASGLLSWRNDASTLGVLLSVTHQEQDIRRDGFESLGYVTANLPGGRTARMPNVINSALFTQKRERTGGTGTIQAVVAEKLELDLTGLYVKGTYDNFNQSRYYFNNFRGAPSNPVVRDGVIVSGNYGNIGTANSGLLLLDAISRKSEIETYAAHLKGKWTDDNWSLGAEIGKTRSTGGTQQQYFGEWEQFTGYSYDISGAPDRVASVTPQVGSTDTTAFNLGFAQLRQQPTADEEVYAQADFSYTIDVGPVKDVLVGIKYRDHETTQASQLRRVNGASTPLTSLSGGPTPSGYLDGISVSDSLRNWVTVNEGALQNFFNTRPASGFVDSAYFDFLPAQFGVKEEIWAGYTQLNLEGEGFRGNVGLRFAHTDQISTGRRDRLGGSFGPPIIPASQITAVSFGNTYNDWMPSANFSFDVTDKLVFRVAASKVIARANFADLSTYLEANNTLLTARGGNPQLQPYQATNFDASAEWYIDRLSMLAATVFFKDISNYIYRATTTETLFNPETGTTNPDGPDFDDYAVSRPRNGGAADVKGFELIYQGDIWNGFGLQASYTFSESSTADPNVALPFSSRHSYSFTPYYEDDLLSARLTYSYRSKYFREVDRATAVTNDGYEQLDAALTINVTDQVALTLQGQNLLDETQYQYVGQENVPFAAYKNGTRYFAGVRFKL
jgi:iron complex outermembrane recepter protein